MLKNQSHDQDAGAEPTPQFATDAEIECAERLRHWLEELYLGRSDALGGLATRREEVH